MDYYIICKKVIGPMNIRNILTNKNQLGRFLVYLVILVPLFYKLISPFFILAGLGAFTVYITGIVLWLGILWSRKDYLSAIRIPDVVFYFLLVLFIYISSGIYPSSSAFIDENIVNFAFFVLPYFFLGLVINYDRDSEIIHMVAYISLFVSIFWQVCLVLRLVEVSETAEGFLGEQMEQGYMLLFPSCYFFAESIRSCRLWDVLASMVAAILLLFMGARGPALLLVLFYVTYLVFFQRYKRNNILKKCVIVLLSLLVAFFYVPILESLMPLANSLGFNTRVFDSFLYGTMISIEESSGRDDIYTSIMSVLSSDQGIIGLGWGGDRSIAEGLWAHNLELEILVQFGLLFGGIILLVLLVLFFRCLISHRQIEEKCFWFILFFLGVMELQLSYTYIRHPLFFVFLGYCISFVRKPKQLYLKTNNK